MDLKRKVVSASKWSIITELLSKLMSPITNMILARLLAPEAFGMVATVTMITSFADLFTDAGFQKYLVQHDFKDEDDYNNSSCIAFWANFVMSVLIWMLIFIFRNNLANIVGNPGLGIAFAVASLSIPITSFSSIQVARLKRTYDFKTLFFIKVIAILIPLFITIPLAFVMRSFWALIIGNICITLACATILTIKSEWKPYLFFSFKKLKDMLDFSVWTLAEQLLGWANLNIGIFVVGAFLNSYYLGLYKTSMASVNQVMEIAVNALSPVLLVTLSRLKNDKNKFDDFFYTFEERISLVVIPLGIGIFVYRDLFTNILLGDQWSEASSFIGLWALARGMLIVFGKFSMEVFVSIGKPKYSVISQSLDFILLLPILLITSKWGYQCVCLARTFLIIWSIITKLILLKLGANISFVRLIKSASPYLITAVLMGCVGSLLLFVMGNNAFLQFVSVFICIVFYFGVLLLFKKTRTVIVMMFYGIINRI